jgi:hypothetical protein
MNKAKALNRNGSSDKLNETLTRRQEFAPKADAVPIADIPHRASSMTPVMREMLARVEGVARWGLNE